MAHNHHDWHLFVQHVSALNRRLSLRRRPPTDELNAFVNPDAYVQALSDIVDAYRPATQDFEEVTLIEQRRAENSRQPWHPRDIDALRTAEASRKVLWDALQRFTAEQSRVRPNAGADAGQNTREWTEWLAEEVLAREQFVSELWAQALDDSVARDRTESRASSAGVSSRGDGAAGPADGDEQGQVAARQSAGSVGGLSRAGDGRKRTREREDDDESNGEKRSRRSSRSNGSPGPLILQEPESSNDRSLDQLNPLEQEVGLLGDFDSKWQTLREQWTIEDAPTWEKLYSRARKLVEANLPGMFPEDSSAATMASFRIKVNTALENVLDWDWEEYIDVIKADKDGLYPEGDLERAELLREVSIQRAQGGQSPIWPPVRKEKPPPAPLVNLTAQARAETADAIANDLIWEGAQHQKPGEWQYLTTFGRGAHGEAQLWIGIRSDDHEKVVERIVVKYFSIEHTWARDDMWISNNFTGNENWLRERAMLAQLSAVGSASGIVKYRGATISTDPKQKQRLYMEYCPHGDLMDLLCGHAKSDGRDPWYDEDSQPIPQVPIPFRALWSFFKDLAAAACIMESGHNPLDPRSHEPDDWDEIIHRDLKPSNVFLAAPLEKAGRGIPVCKVGDFGITVPRDYEPLLNPENMRNAGTKGWKAPECNPYPADFEHNHELTSATDIWAIGRIMLALMELPVRFPLPTIRYDGEDEGHVVVEARDQLVATYGGELYGLVEKCLEPIPDDRIKARALLRATDRQLRNLALPLPLELGEGDILEHAQDMRWAK